MSGHSKWSTIKRKKGTTDARRGKVFTKLIKEITVAARSAGGDPDSNPSLRTAIAAAKAENMPKDNIERAIKRGTGELEGATYEEVCYEGYGPGGAAVLVESLTDNKRRTVADIRYIFSKSGGNLGEAGCVAWMFEKKGLFVLEKGDTDEEVLMDVVLDAGGEDIRDEESVLEVITSQEDFEAVKKALDEKNLHYQFAEVTMVPKSTVKLENKQAEQILRLMDSLEDSDDVQKVYSNFDIADKAFEGIDKV
ncbi:MAG: transcriptional regulator [Desulfobacterales bacterium S3730MH5]|nr:MAG: transcriptional regulator [Desulfobacterales bacterium S3730MH5]OEU84923.1 MAG: transcriptional regulator [Desulfobacterales bacterium S5133MH4]